MDYYMPQIFWHDRQALLSVDIHRIMKGDKYKMVTSSVQKEVRLWEFDFGSGAKLELSVSFLANLTGHNSAINQVKFSPTQNYLASGDCDGRITIWQLVDSPPPPPQDELPPNKENWQRWRILNHDSDVTALCWSPDGVQVASVSNDDCLCVHNVQQGKRVFVIRNFRKFPNGVCWDPLGKYVITMSSDRKMDIVDAVKGTRIRSIGAADLPMRSLKIKEMDVMLENKTYKLFHDDQLFSFQRGLTFSNHGDLVAAPCAHIELGSTDVFGTYIFKRADLARDAPSAFYPCHKPTFLVKFSPVTMQLLEGVPNLLGLPYRVTWAALTKDGVYFYDSQHEHPIGVVDNIHYNSLTDASWSSDGKVLVIASLEGYCSFVTFKLDVWGKLMTDEIPRCASPNLIEEKKKKRKSQAAPVVEEEKAVVAPKTPARKEGTAPTKAITPLTKYFKEVDKSDKKSSTTKDVKKEENDENAKKTKKRIQLVTLTD